MHNVEVGRIYQHFKGNLFLVTGTNFNQDGIAIVEYTALYGSCQRHSRPLFQFKSEIDDRGVAISDRSENLTNQTVRFRLVGTGFKCISRELDNPTVAGDEG